MARTVYTANELATAILRDLVTDIRCAERDEMPEYAETCRQQFRQLWPVRHGCRFDRNGWPLVVTR